jgi:hypothetical protein
MFGPENKEMTGGWRKLQNDELQSLYSHSVLLGWVKWVEWVKHVACMRQYEKCIQNVGFEVFMVVTMKNAVFWDVAPRGFIRRFGGTCRFHLQGRRNNTQGNVLDGN